MEGYEDELYCRVTFPLTLRERVALVLALVFGWSPLRVCVRLPFKEPLSQYGDAEWSMFTLPWWDRVLSRLRYGKLSPMEAPPGVETRA